jgi:hypothetical protein
MALTLNRVQPGDIISSEFFNQILDELGTLNQRLSALEGTTTPSTSVVISDLIPPSGIVRVGEELRVVGRNFGQAVGSARVFIDSTRVDAFKLGSNDQLLVFDVPATINDVPGGGRPAVLTVSNGMSSAQRNLFLQAAMQLQGNIDVVPTGIQPATPTAGSLLTFSFNLVSRANLEASYLITPAITVAVNQSVWENNLRVIDQNGAVSSARRIPVGAGQTVPFSVVIDPVPAGTNGTTFRLAVAAEAGNVRGNSGVQEQIVGQAGEPIDSTISLAFASGRALTGGGAVDTASQVDSTGIHLSPLAAFARVQFNATLPTINEFYDVTVSLVSPAANWEVRLISPPPTAVDPAKGTYNPTTPGQLPQIPEFSVRPLAGAVNGEIELRLQHRGALGSQRKRLALQRIF